MDREKDGNVAIVADDKEFIVTQDDFIPQRDILAVCVGFNQSLPVDHDDSTTDRDSLAREPDDPFEQNGISALLADGDDISPARGVPAVSQLIDQVDAAVFEGGRHAIALDPNGNENEFERDEDDHHQGKHADQRPLWSPANQCPSPPGADFEVWFLCSVRFHVRFLQHAASCLVPPTQEQIARTAAS